jgi:hypothetical protein
MAYTSPAVLAAVEQIQDAWTVPGPVPEYHRAMQNQLLQEWPTLALAVMNLNRAIETMDG